jgi:hypothetical protein
MKVCLHCNKEFENKKETAKFCSVSHRVMWNRENKDKLKGLTEKQRLEIIYNSILELVDKTNIQHPIQSATSTSVSYENALKFENEGYSNKPKIYRSFEYYQTARIECCDGDDWAKLKIEILASSLSPKEKSLLTN